VRFARQHPAIAEHRAIGDLAQGGTRTAAAYTVFSEHRSRWDLTLSEIQEEISLT
jgi:hypothetical protein